ncbi:MAG TPA: dipeptidase [Rhodothermales bacterium]|nr:dipeptidase [Rhodothermales bacterium]
MTRILLLFLLTIVLLSMTSCEPNPETTPDSDTEDESLHIKAETLARESIIVDGHIDVPYRMTELEEDISEATEHGDFDYPRAETGGLDAPFMSIYLPADRQDTPGSSKALADSLIDMVESFVARAPNKFALAKSVADVRANHEAGLMSLPMGMENGSGIEDDLAHLQHFYDRGIRYITLTHAVDNKISDSSYDTTGTWNGLSDFGREVVAEMNRLGIMVDVSHVSDSAFYQVMEISTAPVIASHSSARHFTPGFERNMNDDMIRLLAEKNGVIMINFGSSFLSEEYRTKREAADAHIETYLEENNLTEADSAAQEYTRSYYADHVGYADISNVVAHIDHVVNLVGIDHVGLGSDFDGVGDSLPIGLKDVSAYPSLVYELLKKGYSDEDIKKILGENALRVWSEVEQLAAASQAD